MRKVTRTINDDRFQTWPKILRWMTTYHNKLQREKKSHLSARSRSSTNSLLKTLFKNNLSPVLNNVEMNKNGKAFLSSLLKTVGKDAMVKRFNHRLRDGELPEDISSLIFSPLFIKIRDQQVEKITSTRIEIDSDLDDPDDELSDWSEDDNQMIKASGHRATSPIHLELLPSIEDRDGDSIHGKERHSSEADHRTHHSRSRRPLNTPGDLARQSTLSLRRPEARNEEALFVGTAVTDVGSSLPPASSILPFSQILPRSESERRSLSRIKSLARHLSKEKNETGLGQGGSDETTRNAGQPSTAPKLDKRKKPKKRAKKQGRGSTTSLSSPKKDLQNPPKASGAFTTGPNSIPLPKALVKVRPTPAVIQAENQKQAQRLAKPLAPKKIPNRAPPPKTKSAGGPQGGHGEIRPKGFYNTANSQAQVHDMSKPVPLEPSQGNQASKRPSRDRENNASRDHNAVKDNLRDQPTSTCDDSLSPTPPSLEEMFQPKNHTAAAPRGEIQKQESMQTQTPTKTTPRGKKNRKRSRSQQEGDTNEDHAISPSRKHIRFTEEDGPPSGSSVAAGKAQSTPRRMPNGHKHGGAQVKSAPSSSRRDRTWGGHRHHNDGNIYHNYNQHNNYSPRKNAGYYNNGHHYNNDDYYNSGRYRNDGYYHGNGSYYDTPHHHQQNNRPYTASHGEIWADNYTPYHKNHYQVPYGG